LKVCIVTYEYPPALGGEASYARDLAEGLASAGHEVTVLLPAKRKSEHPPGAGVRLLALKISALPMLKVASFVIAANKVLPALVAAGRAEVVHVAFDYPSFPFRARGLGAPLLATVHHLHVAESVGALRLGRGVASAFTATVRGFLLSSMEGVLVRRASAAIAVSGFTRRTLEEYLGVPKARTRVVPNGVRTDDVIAARDIGVARRKFGLGTGPFILFVGRLEKSKGVEYLIDAFASVVRVEPSLHLAIVGGGSASYTRALRKRAAALGLGESVRFTGRVDRTDLCEVYASCRAVVLPSLMEGFGITLIEAMAAGKPCISTRVGAVPELVRDGENGYLVPPADPGALSAAMVRLNSLPDRGAGMGAAGRAFAEAFSSERMARETANVYAEFVRRGSGREPVAVLA
jgi:glycosyltransferase involved in cell wall biosynthesis